MFSVRVLISFFLALAIGLISSACDSQERVVAATEMSAPSITIIPGKDDVQSEVTLQDGLTIVDIVSESGIGSAEIRYPTQPQPESIVLRMHLGGLEDLQIKSRESTIQASVSSIHPYPVLQSIVTQGEESDKGGC